MSDKLHLARDIKQATVNSTLSNEGLCPPSAKVKRSENLWFTFTMDVVAIVVGFNQYALQFHLNTVDAVGEKSH